ncbi:SecDF P1 head subdomain-containing protein [Psychroserpens algicola]|uniref:SecDF P1 head subdomain-containing protein n=1 Tax=Psychroserpens algicola TaxID=1719034 RepID=UPI001954C4B1|nr:hypothetical protein [Psychroserpens algicola]
MKYMYLFVVVALLSCGNVTPKHKFSIIYEFENSETVSDNEKQGTVETLNKRLAQLASNYDVKLNNKQQIELKLSTDFNVNRLNTIITNSGKLEFWEVVRADDLGVFFLEANALLKKDQEEIEPIFDLINSNDYVYGLFSVSKNDTTQLSKYLNKTEVKQLLPAHVKHSKFLYGIPDELNNMPLYLVKTPPDGIALINETHIVDARQSYTYTNRPTVSIKMNELGSNRWERMTGIAYQQQSQIAITLNDMVYSAPTVSSGAITGGNTEIAGSFTLEQAQDLALILSSHRRIPKLKFVNSSAINDKE